MSIEIKMPELSPTMTKGLLANWLVNVGSEVKAGDVIAEVETDKVSVEIEAQADGVVAQIITQTGAEADVDAVIMIMNAPGTAPVQSPEPAPENVEKPALIEVNTTAQTKAETKAETDQEIQPNTKIELPSQLNFSPLAKRMALQQNIDVTALQNTAGTGAKGKIVKRDIEKLLGISVEQAASAAVTSATVTSSPAATLPNIDLSLIHI